MKNRLSFLIFLFSFSVSLLQGMIDPDLFWHIRGGSDIIENGKIVLKDSWNYLFEGKEWVNQQWLIEVIFASLYNIGGISLIFFFKGIIAGLIGLILFKSFERVDKSVSFISTIIVISIIARYFMMRTQFFSFLFFSILFYILEKLPFQKRFIAIPPLFVIWANSHAFFGLGLFSLTLFVLGEILLKLLKVKSFTPIFQRDNIINLLLIPISFLSTLFNPFTYKIYMTAKSLFVQRQETLISEWQPIWKYSLSGNLPFYSYILILIFLAIILYDKIKLKYLFTTFPLLLFGFYSVRIMPFAIINSFLLFSSLFFETIIYLKINKEKIDSVIQILAILILILSISAISFRLTHPLFIPDTKYREDYPIGAINYLKSNNLKGKIFNEFDWGGFIVFSSKDFKTVIDGRTAVLLYPEDYLLKWRDIVDAKYGFEEKLKEGDPDFVLLYSDDFLAMALSQSSDWEMVYGDSISVLFKRKR